jgi:hypothetical protein
MISAYCVIKPYTPLTEEGMHRWRVSLGGMSTIAIAPSHQVAKRVVMEYWSLQGEAFFAVIRQRISEKWRGGLKAKRESLNTGASLDARWMPAK